MHPLLTKGQNDVAVKNVYSREIKLNKLYIYRVLLKQGHIKAFKQYIYFQTSLLKHIKLQAISNCHFLLTNAFRNCNEFLDINEPFSILATECKRIVLKVFF